MTIGATTTTPITMTTVSSSSLCSSRRRRFEDVFSLRRRAAEVDFLVNNNDRIAQQDAQDDKEDLSIQQLPVNQILRQLSPDELETAARFSYDYLKDGKKKNLQPHLYAKKLARIYLEKHRSSSHNNGENDDESIKKNETSDDIAAEKALAEMKATLQFRKQFNVDGLRTVFDNNNKQHDDDGVVSPACRRDFCHRTFYENLGSKKLYVQGYDRQGRSTYIFVPRNVQHHDAEWTLREHVYTLERALACSKSKDHKVNAIVDFNGYCRHKHAPPVRMGMDFISVLGQNYAPTIHQVFFVDAPVAFFVIWAVFKPLIGKFARRNKVNICFVQSKSNKDSKTKNRRTCNVLERYYEPHQAASWMLPSGTKNRDLDIDEYLHRTPFNQAFDERVTE